MREFFLVLIQNTELANTGLPAVRSLCVSQMLIMGTGLWTLFGLIWSLLLNHATGMLMQVAQVQVLMRL